jgi:GT2 family glycosyltransferase
MIEVSVVVPTYQRPELLERCLSALLAQSLPRGVYEIIVADDAASATTRAQVERCRSPGAMLRYLPVTGATHGPAAARNAGWRRAAAPLIAFTDDDTMPTTTWLERGVDMLRGGRVAAVSGRVVVPLRRQPTDYERDTASLETAGFVTANCFVRREVLRVVGGFDEQFAIAWREDTDLYFRLLDQRLEIAHASAAVVVHPVRTARWGVSVSQQRKSSYDALLYKKHPVRYARHVRPGRPTLYYPIVAALLAMLAGLVTRQSAVLSLAAVTWLTLTTIVAVRRLRGNSLSASHIAEMVLTSALIPPISLFWRSWGAVRHRVLFW